MDESPIRKTKKETAEKKSAEKKPAAKKTTSAKKPAEEKKPASRSRKAAVPVAQVLKDALQEVRGLEASILEDVVMDADTLSVEAPIAEETVAEEPIAEAAVVAEEEPTSEPVEETPVEAAPVVAPPRKKKRRKRRKVRYAAPLGFMVLLLALVGVISLCIGAVQLIQKWTDDSELRAELTQFLDPVTQMCPTPFDDAGRAEGQDTLISSAIYSIAQPEYVRWLHEGDDCKFTYERDEMGRLIVPQKQVERAFSALFGSEKIQSHHTVGDAEYNEETACYHIPIQHTTAGYVPVLDTIDRDGDEYTVRVAYVLQQDIRYDYRGQALEPTADMGKYAQKFVVKRNRDDSWTILSVEAEEQVAE